ncbi:hypothetical protein [Mycobacterium sp. 1274761.0]|uniref:hypothetical protein n=1 Tax=Mycobacterium sp. 1274761.0 TaxID=1834077 RepID=UPI0007FDAF3A|nr:hypothetical protein [Mycobacterium sp. 1274761.0]OBK73771.1 hypothetical protein A5651_13465 [Mycobacterium sp. 1274761.0]
MPDDVLRFIIGPMPYSPWWLWCGLALLAAVSAWCVGVIVWTLPTSQLRTIPWIRSLHAKLLRRKFSRAIRAIDNRYRAGELTPAEASHQMSRTLRAFLHQATGVPAQYMHVGEIRCSELAEAAPLFSALNDARFNTASPVEISQAGSAAEELIRTWP